MSRALVLLLLVSVPLAGVGCTRKQPPAPREAAPVAQAPGRKVAAVAPQERSRQSARSVDPDPAPAVSSFARKPAVTPPKQASTSSRSYEAYYPRRTPDGREPMWRQRARTY